MSFYRPLRHEAALLQYIDGKEVATKTITCSHCTRVMVIRYMQLAANIEYGGYCRGCDRHICARCWGLPTCRTIEQHCDELEAKDRARQSYEMVMNF